MTAIGIVYLVWVPLGLLPLERFLTSYTYHPAGLYHDLIIVFNGHQTAEELAPFQERLSNIPHLAYPIASPQQDIASYLAVSQAFSHDHLCFLNSYSELQASDWLLKLNQPLTSDKIGLSGATASWETRQIIVPLRNLRTWLRYRLYNRRWPPFPNPHIRSTGFMLARSTMLRLSAPPIRTKEDAYRFESGFSSMTRQIQSWNLKTVLVDREGAIFEPTQWAHTRTFRSDDQRQLLITDNRTRQYQDADDATKRHWSQMSWGNLALPLTKA